MKKSLLTLLLVAGTATVVAQTQGGGTTTEMLRQIKQAQSETVADKALRNALFSTSINQLATSPERTKACDVHFSDKVNSKGITDQASSGRCWLFTGLNVMRA